MNGGSRPILLIAEGDRFSPEALARLEACFQVRLADLDRRGLLDEVADVDVLWVRLRNMIDEHIFAAGKSLKVVATNTTGLTHIDLVGAERRGVRVVSLRGETDFLRKIRATAEHTLALTLALLRHVPSAQLHVRSGGWDRDLFMGSEIHGAQVGIVGYGRLGQMTAQLFSAFGAKVQVCSRDLVPGGSVDSFPVLGLDDLLPCCDILSVHVNYESSNEGLFDAQRFGLMKPGSVFINTSRGELVDESALLQSLSCGRLAGAAVDVLRDEQRSPTRSPEWLSLIDSGKLVITPHIGGNTHQSRAMTEVLLAERLVEVFVNS